MDRVIILGHGKPYDFKNDLNEQVKGVKISYINQNSCNQVGIKGYTPFQVSLDPIVLNDLKSVPGVYDVEYGMKPGKNNKPEAVVTSFKFVKELELSPLFK